MLNVIEGWVPCLVQFTQVAKLCHRSTLERTAERGTATANAHYQCPAQLRKPQPAQKTSEGIQATLCHHVNAEHNLSSVGCRRYVAATPIPRPSTFAHAMLSPETPESAPFDLVTINRITGLSPIDCTQYAVCSFKQVEGALPRSFLQFS
jgi:hypothetical protein